MRIPERGPLSDAIGALAAERRAAWRAKLRCVATKALEIMDAHSVGADLDAGFDGGEFSGPAHARMEQDAIEALAEENGFTFDQVMDELNSIANEEVVE